MRHHHNTVGQTSTGGQPLRSTKPSTEHAALAALLDRAGAFLARNDEALGAVVGVLCSRTPTLFANCTSAAVWTIVELAVQMAEPAAGSA